MLQKDIRNKAKQAKDRKNIIFIC
uniref:Uncharacterized protein n=1 Tax=Romanomermis culicivorax TaxID=13658 RepID=A0A915LD60_ROMCU